MGGEVGGWKPKWSGGCEESMGSSSVVCSMISFIIIKRMAQRLARIFGTEEDKVNCAFYHKIGACRHGDRCNRLHNKPLLS